MPSHILQTGVAVLAVTLADMHAAHACGGDALDENTLHFPRSAEHVPTNPRVWVALSEGVELLISGPAPFDDDERVVPTAWGDIGYVELDMDAEAEAFVEVWPEGQDLGYPTLAWSFVTRGGPLDDTDIWEDDEPTRPPVVKDTEVIPLEPGNRAECDGEENARWTVVVHTRPVTDMVAVALFDADRGDDPPLTSSLIASVDEDLKLTYRTDVGGERAFELVAYDLAGNESEPALVDVLLEEQPLLGGCRCAAGGDGIAGWPTLALGGLAIGPLARRRRS